MSQLIVVLGWLRSEISSYFDWHPVSKSKVKKVISTLWTVPTTCLWPALWRRQNRSFYSFAFKQLEIWQTSIKSKSQVGLHHWLTIAQMVLTYTFDHSIAFKHTLQHTHGLLVLFRNGLYRWLIDTEGSLIYLSASFELLSSLLRWKGWVSSDLLGSDEWIGLVTFGRRFCGCISKEFNNGA